MTIWRKATLPVPRDRTDWCIPPNRLSTVTGLYSQSRKTFVNESGRAVTSLFTRFRATANDLIVVYDEMALPSGKVRIRAWGGDGGHNGMKSIIGAVGTQEFVRVRIGIGRPEGQVGDVDHVLSRPE